MTTENSKVIDETSISDLVRKCFSAYELKDRQMIEDLLSDDFTFTSPLDDRIDRTEYFKRCWPNSETIRTFQIEKLFENGNEAFVRYECETKVGKKFRNTEWFRFEGGKLKEVQVYFGEETQSANEEGTDEAQIHTIIDDLAKATREGDDDAVLSNHAANLLIFDVLAPLQYKGVEAYRKGWDEWRPTDEGEALFEIHELSITAGETVAFAHCLIECGKKPNLDWVRATFCLQKSDGKWMIMHQHSSMPVSRKGA